MSEIIFSVLVLTYNQEKTIKKTLDSIVGQNTNYKYEIIIADDCSMDSTRKIVNEYAGRYPELIIPVFNKTNIGVVGNYYNALSYTRGKYIMVCAGDDWWLPAKSELQIHYMEQHPDIGMVYGKVERYMEKEKKFVACKECIYEESFEELIRENHIAALSTCIRKDVMMKYIEDVKPDEKGWLMEDFPICLWFAYNSKIHFLNEYVAVYRVVDGSISHPQNQEKLISFEDSVYDIQCFFMKRYNYKNEEIARRHYIRKKNIYASFNNKKMYRAMLKKLKDKKIKIILSYIPLYTRMLNLKSRLKNKNS